MPGTSFNIGWKDLALKISHFIRQKILISQPSITRGISKSFLDIIKQHRYQTKEIATSRIEKDSNKIVIEDVVYPSGVDVLNRCLVGDFEGGTGETPTASDVQRWPYRKWAQGVQIFEMNCSHFLFEHPIRKVAEHVLRG